MGHAMLSLDCHQLCMSCTATYTCQTWQRLTHVHMVFMALVVPLSMHHITKHRFVQHSLSRLA